MSVIKMQQYIFPSISKVLLDKAYSLKIGEVHKLLDTQMLIGEDHSQIEGPLQDCVFFLEEI